MRVLLFAPAFAPYMGSESLVTSKLVMTLRRADCDVDVISRCEQELYSNNWESPWTDLQACTQELVPPPRSKVLLIAERVADALTLGHPTAGLRWARLAVKRGRQMLAEKHYDALISRSPPETGHLPALILARETGIPWMANWNDPPVGAWPAPYTNGSQMHQWIYKRLARQVLNLATAHTFPSERLAQHIFRHFKITPTATTAIIPHAAMPGLQLQPLKMSTDVFRLCHAGKLCNARDPRKFLEGVRQFLAAERLPAGQFIFDQIGHVDSDLQVLSREYGIQEHVRCTGPMTYLATMEYLSQSDVAVLVEAPCEEGIFLPSKLVDYAQTGRPILAASPINGTVADLMAKHGGGIAADTSSCESIAKALTALYRAWKRRELDEKFNSRELGKQFESGSILEGYRVIFQDLRIECKFSQRYENPKPND